MAGMSSRAASRVVVVMGGPSAEREVSLISGRECAAALREAGYEVVTVDAGADLSARQTFPSRLMDAKPHVIFNALHGRWGEDGAVQGLFEWLRIPYTHSGVLASSLAMDKERSKDVFRAVGLPVAQSVVATSDDVRSRHVMTPPYVVKPCNEGSSVGVYIVPAGADAPPELAPDMPAMVMVETFVPGRELTVTVMDDRALCVTDIVTDDWYDYDAKYKPGGSRHVCPAHLPAAVTDACLEYALTAHRVLGCRGVSRSDFRWDEGRGLAGLILLETNTQPGMTPTSLSPEQARAQGIGFSEFCAWMVEDASCDR